MKKLKAKYIIITLILLILAISIPPSLCRLLHISRGADSNGGRNECSPKSSEEAAPAENQISGYEAPPSEEVSASTENNLNKPSSKHEGYTIKIYTKAPNVNSSVYVEYPYFYGKDLSMLNTIIYDKVITLGTDDSITENSVTGLISNYQVAVTLQNSKVVSMVFWGSSYFTDSQHPWSNLVGFTVDLLTMEEIKLSDLFPLDDLEFRKTFFEHAIFPGDPITSYDEENFEAFFPHYPYHLPLENIYNYDGNFYLKPEGVVISRAATHATGNDHMEALLTYDFAESYYLLDQFYWDAS